MSRKRRGWYFLSLVLVVALMAVYAERRDLYGRYLKYQETEEERHALQAQLEALESEERRVREQVQSLEQENPVEIEAELRRGNLVRKGETIYRIELPPKASNE